MFYNWRVDISDAATTDDVVALINKTINDYSNSTTVTNIIQEVTQGKPISKLDFMHKIFQYACDKLKYERDPVGWERIFTPELMLQIGKADCKKFTTLLGAILKKMNVPFIPKVVSYDGKHWEHIYIIVPGTSLEKYYFVLDPVNDCKFNDEVDHVRAELHYVTGGKNEVPGNSVLKDFSYNAGCVLADLAAISGKR